MLPSRLSWVAGITFEDGRQGPVGASVTYLYPDPDRAHGLYREGGFVALVADLSWTWNSMDEIEEVTQ